MNKVVLAENAQAATVTAGILKFTADNGQKTAG